MSEDPRPIVYLIYSCAGALVLAGACVVIGLLIVVISAIGAAMGG